MGKVLPNNIVAEKKLLGQCICYPEAALKALDALSSECFFHLNHQSIFDGITHIVKSGATLDLISLSEHLERNNKNANEPHYLMELVNQTFTSVGVETCVDVIRDRYHRRKLIRMAHEILRDAYDSPDETPQIVNRAQVMLLEMEDNRRDAGRFLHEAADDVVIWMEKINERTRNGEKIMGDVRSGFREIDLITGGFDYPELVVIAAPSSVGKSALAQAIAEFNALQGNCTAIFPVEMGQLITERRQILSMARVSMSAIRRGQMTGKQAARVMKVCGELQNKKIPLITTSDIETIDEIAIKAERYKREHDLKMIIVDYFQLIKAEGKFGIKSEELEEISGKLVRLKKRLNLIVVVLSQFKDDGIKELETGNPQPDKLRQCLHGTRRLSNDADTMISLWKDAPPKREKKGKEADLEAEPERVYKMEYHGETVDYVERHGIICKARNGPLLRFRLKLILDYIRFLDDTEAELTPF